MSRLEAPASVLDILSAGAVGEFAEPVSAELFESLVELHTPLWLTGALQSHVCELVGLSAR